jgi:hypothetical protein
VIEFLNVDSSVYEYINLFHISRKESWGSEPVAGLTSDNEGWDEHDQRLFYGVAEFNVKDG